MSDDFEAQLLAQMRQDFLAESQEILERLGTLLVQLEEGGGPDLLHTVFRELHTLKGTAGFVGFESMRALAHKMEDVFGALRDGRLVVTPDLVDAAFAGLHALTAMREDVLRGGSGEVDSSAAVAGLEAAARGPATEPSTILPEPAEAPPSPPPSVAPGGVDATAGAAPASPDPTLRVPVETLDRMMELVGELITARNALLTRAEQLHDEPLLDAVAAVSRLTRELQARVTAVRLTPVERLFNRFTGVVRQTARECGKRVRLVIEGSDTPLDRAISDQMYDPLVHLLRNAVDHGLELPEERTQRGKPEEGVIRLSAERRGDNVILRVADDGRGIDPLQVRRAAVARGLRSAEEAAALTDEQAIHLIFATGLSTAAQVTDMSGRGVGLDVVAQNVRRLRGSVTVQSVVGQGTTFVIQLPLTLAILEVQLVRVGRYTYAIPLHVVRETLRIAPAAIQTMQRGEVIFVRDAVLPLRRLTDYGLGGENGAARPGEPLPAPQNGVVVRLTGQDEVLAVDELVGKQQVVIKPLSPYLGVVRGVEGAATLPDGSVTLVLDVEGLMRR